jgi:hypothetical protein
MKKIFLAVLAAAVLGVASEARASGAFDARLAGSPVYSDLAFQDFVETAYGYLNPRHAPQPAPAYRDAVAASPAVASQKGGPGYIFVSILPSTTDYSSLLSELSGAAGFILKGERTSYSKGFRQTRILGWVKTVSLQAVRANPGVAAVYVGKGSRSAKRRV